MGEPGEHAPLLAEPIARRAIAAILCAVFSIVGFGCASPARVATSAEPLPSYESLQILTEARAGGLDSLWARAVISIRFTDADGKSRREQGEGHFQRRRPRDLAITIGKLGETYLHLGADGDRYWFIDRSGKEAIALVGEHALAEARILERLGLPVPLGELAALAAMEPLPVAMPAGTRLSWAPGSDRLVRVAYPLGGAWVRSDIDRFTGDPANASILRDPAGDPVVHAELRDYQRVLVRGGGMIAPRAPGVIEIVGPVGEDGSPPPEIRLTLSDPEISARRPVARVFDLDTLLRAYSVERVIDLDRPDPGPGPSSELKPEPTAGSGGF